MRGGPAEIFAGGGEDRLRTIERHARQEDAVRKLRESCACAADTDERLDAIVIGLKVGVTERPIHAVAISGSSLELVVRHPIGSARPMQAAAAQAARPPPLVGSAGRGRVRVLFVIDHDAVVAFTSAIAPQQTRCTAAAIFQLIEKGVMELF